MSFQLSAFSSQRSAISYQLSVISYQLAKIYPYSDFRRNLKMHCQPFILRPFFSSDSLPDLAITGYLIRRGAGLAIGYLLRGSLEEIVVPPPVDPPARRRRLWEDTCLEFFLAPKDSPGYWEFNLSPAGHWNVYGFQAYRQGMTEAEAFSTLPFRVEGRSDSLVLHLEFDLAGIAAADQRLDAAVAAVIKGADGRVTYWALAHPGPQPDFHRRDSFIIEL